jgi:hypothetical protein
MEDIALMVSASLARHGFATQVDHRRLQWSQWSRCESSLSVLLVPGKPGLFQLAEEQRTLTLFRLAETEDLGMALARLFLLNTPERDRLSRKPCYVRYAVIEDEDQRHSAYRSLQEWMASPSQSSVEIPDNLAVHNFTAEEEVEGGDKSAA